MFSSRAPSLTEYCRGDDTIKLYDWMDTLREEAPAKGGQVLTHLGNHEWMNVIGDWRYVCGEVITMVEFTI